MNGPAWVCCATPPGIPIDAGIWRAAPFTRSVTCAWRWKSVCSPALQLMPSTGDPVAAVAVLASAGALGIGTASGPSGPAAGAGCSAPRVLNGADPGGVLDEPPLTASVTPTAIAAAAMTAPPPIAATRIRRLRRCSAWRACSRRCLLLSREFCLDTASAYSTIYPERTRLALHGSPGCGGDGRPRGGRLFHRPDDRRRLHALHARKRGGLGGEELIELGLVAA